MGSEIEFRTIPSYPDFEVSRCGKIRNRKSGRLHTPCMGRYYMVVSIRRDGKPCTRMVHRLLAEAYIPNPDSKPQINHKDGNKHDNRLENLEWCTAKENVRHARETGLMVTPVGELSHTAKLTEEDVLEIRRLISSGMDCVQISKRFGVSGSAIRHIAYGESWAHLPKEDGLSSIKSRKLSKSVVLEIRRLYSTGMTHKNIASVFGISRHTVSSVISGRRGAHVKEPSSGL